MKEQYIYFIEVNGIKLRDDFYEEDELEKLYKNIAFSRKLLPDDKFEIVKFKRVNSSSPPKTD